MTDFRDDQIESDALGDEALDRYWDTRFTFSGSA
jgi:hypothetical protein